MAIKLEAIGNYLILTDTITGDTVAERPVNTVSYRDEGNKVVIYSTIEGKLEKLGSQKGFLLEDVVDSTGSAFGSFALLLSFLRNNTGFNIAGSTALQTSEYSDRVIADGGTVTNLTEVKLGLRQPYTTPDPSLVLIPSGTKAGKTYMQKPSADTYGPELVVNGDFSDGVTLWNLSRGTRSVISSQYVQYAADGLTGYSSHNLGTGFLNVPLLISIDVVGGTSPTGTLMIGGSSGSSSGGGLISLTGIGTFTAIITNTTDANRVITIVGSSTTLGESIIVDNISVKEVLTQISDGTHQRASTATYIAEDGVMRTAAIDEPRIDFTDGEGVLLLEDEATNFVLYSQNFTNGVWSNVGSTITKTLNYGLAPDGTTTSTRIQFSTSNLSLRQNLTGIITGNTYNSFIYVKGNPGETINFQALDATIVGFVLTGGWDKIINPINSATVNHNIQIHVYIGATARDIQVWGAQLEEGSTASSYIPTNGATVTRVRDIATDFGNVTEFNSEEGTLFVEFKVLNKSTSFPGIRLTSLDNENQVSFYTYNGTITVYIKSANVNSISFQENYPTNTTHKLAIRYSFDKSSIFINGIKKNEYLNRAMPIVLQTLKFETSGNISNYKQLKVFKRALSDAELTALTS